MYGIFTDETVCLVLESIQYQDLSELVHYYIPDVHLFLSIGLFFDSKTLINLHKYECRYICQYFHIFSSSLYWEIYVRLSVTDSPEIVRGFKIKAFV